MSRLTGRQRAQRPKKILLRLPALWRHQERFVRDLAQFTVCKSATKTGKTMACAWWLANEAANTPGTLWWWIGPTTDVGLIGYKSVLHLLGPAVMHKIEKPYKARLWNGSVIALKSAQEPEYLRGAGVQGMVLDEAGSPLFDKAWPEIRTTISATRGRLKIIGNPGDAGSFMDRAETWGRDANVKEWSFHFFNYLDRPTARQADLDQAKRELGEDSNDFKRYYLGETIQGGSGFFYGLEKVCIGQREEPQKDARYIIGVDTCIKSDFFVASVFRCKENRQVEISRHKGPPSPQQEAEIERLAKAFNEAAVMIEVNGPGGPIYQNLCKRGVRAWPFETSGKSKPEVLHDYRADIAYERITLLEDQDQMKEHQMYQSRRTTAGTTKYGAPHGWHDDRVMANAIAAHALRRMVPAELAWVC